MQEQVFRTRSDECGQRCIRKGRSHQENDTVGESRLQFGNSIAQCAGIGIDIIGRVPVYGLTAEIVIQSVIQYKNQCFVGGKSLLDREVPMGNILLICQKAGDDSGESTGRRRSAYRTVYSTGTGKAGYTAADGVTACNIGKYAVAEIDYIPASEREKANSE